ncbi:MAG: CpxP family protein [Gammaproteobacteria bacterium]|uniref:CpxP family protein n=1 Tax=Marinomonas sp. ef1 TaxID=2005043 RepID=UPI000C29245B|nr:CpxP family protein [Marinomonas sp. ef1]MBU1296944.1 CpxP family protein [Gammaproteobacteria bacterium]MBU1467384.1 CpxP family protein [Gammaproteobacteria bacterium]MBU2023737.1 CpxP family protein [Gammaproteobacteria bacterium]MBU2240144.1 CpxP family protein [Gammaproteobacteria bacterium]MBU2319246.1 CpxP family protein [Gammaproteobacteria bacterium]
MKMAKKLILASVVLPLVLSTSAFAFGGKDHKGSQEECRPGLDRGMMKELNLTDSQKEQFKTLRQANKEEMKERFNDKKEQGEKARMAHFDKVNSLLMADKFDPAKATELAQEMSDKQVKRQVDMLSKQHKMLSILTPEQKTKFIELQKERMEDCDDMPRHHGKDRK